MTAGSLRIDAGSPDAVAAPAGSTFFAYLFMTLV